MNKQQFEATMKQRELTIQLLIRIAAALENMNKLIKQTI